MHTPAWLKSPVVPSDEIYCEDTIPVEFEVPIDELSSYLHSHQHGTTKVKRWTVSQLKSKKASLLRQLEKERVRQAEIASLREECCSLAAELDNLRSHCTSTGMV